MSDRPFNPVPSIWRSEDQPGFQRTFLLELDDHLDIQFASRQLMPTAPTLGAAAVVGVFVASVLFYEQWRSGAVGSFLMWVFALASGFAMAAAALLGPWRKFLRYSYRKQLEKAGAIGQIMDATIDRNGLGYTIGGQSVSCTWDSLYALEEEDGTFYFWMSKTVTHPWPARLFESEEERQTFRDRVRHWSGRSFASPPLLARLGASGRANLPG